RHADDRSAAAVGAVGAVVDCVRVLVCGMGGAEAVGAVLTSARHTVPGSLGMSLVIESATYPAAMDEKLRSIRRRQCVLAVARAGLLAGGVLVSGVLAAMGIDAWLNLFEPLVRLGLTVLALLAAGAVLVGACVGPISRMRALARAAAEADRA